MPQHPSQDGPLRAALIVLGVLVGAKILEDALTPRAPCPRCGTRLKAGTGRCPACGAALAWGVPARAA
jgi:uncharacterized Zn finger protein (UPF0148 family)